jgi:hypothetical protein
MKAYHEFKAEFEKRFGRTNEAASKEVKKTNEAFERHHNRRY